MRLSGAVSYHLMKPGDGTGGAFLIADVPLSDANQCDDCGDDPGCRTVVQYLEELVEDGSATDVFVEASFIDKLSRREKPGEALSRGLARVVFDDRTIYSALNFIRMLQGAPQIKSSVVGKVFKRFADNFVADKDKDRRESQARFHYTDIRFEPVAYAVMQHIVMYQRGSVPRLTTESWKFVTSRLPLASKYVSLFMAFADRDNVLAALRDEFGLRMPESLEKFVGSERGEQKVRRALLKCSDADRDRIHAHLRATMHRNGLQYAALMESHRDDRRNSTLDRDVYEVWAAGFHALLVAYTASRLVRYARASDSNVVLVATADTVSQVREILTSCGYSTKTRIVGVSDSSAHPPTHGSVMPAHQMSAREKCERASEASRYARCLYVEPSRVMAQKRQPRSGRVE